MRWRYISVFTRKRLPMPNKPAEPSPEVKNWRNGMRVRIVAHQGFDDMNGITGKVVRICKSNGCAWIEADNDLPPGRNSFPRDDEHGRGRHTKVYMDECEEVTEKISLTEAVRIARGDLKPPAFPVQFDGAQPAEPSPEPKQEETETICICGRPLYKGFRMPHVHSEADDPHCTEPTPTPRPSPEVAPMQEFCGTCRTIHGEGKYYNHNLSPAVAPRETQPEPWKEEFDKWWNDLTFKKVWMANFDDAFKAGWKAHERLGGR
jgi:hypothetical protein